MNDPSQRKAWVTVGSAGNSLEAYWYRSLRYEWSPKITAARAGRLFTLVTHKA
ncbi:hypothetical protein ACFVWG_23080 [Kribbella sp. NPDC058245]|uniref:hypothetical protein n=1 Tax=Kribbella sp. NPDC058245 TaxID=3346399 RepID=UPI0036F029FA